MTGLSGRALRRTYRGRAVLDDVTLELGRGEAVGLLGPNGSGKTTALGILAGLVRPEEGEVHLGERDVTALRLHERARLGIGYIPQESSVFTRMTVRENLCALPQLLAKATARFDEIVSELALGDLLGARAAELSGGERKRVEIARALILGAELLLLDEPLAGLDPQGRAEVGRIVAMLREAGKGVLITDHSFEDVLRFTSRVYVLAGGKVVCQGGPDEVLANPGAQSAYFRPS